jgi:hypothetical protein
MDLLYFTPWLALSVRERIENPVFIWSHFLRNVRCLLADYSSYFGPLNDFTVPIEAQNEFYTVEMLSFPSSKITCTGHFYWCRWNKCVIYSGTLNMCIIFHCHSFFAEAQHQAPLLNLIIWTNCKNMTNVSNVVENLSIHQSWCAEIFIETNKNIWWIIMLCTDFFLCWTKKLIFSITACPWLVEPNHLIYSDRQKSNLG